MSENPLKQYFRTPAIHLDLPSKGKFYPDGAIKMPESGEVPVYPMTAIDEITYKTPDALFNGSAIVDVIKSCIPAIDNPWNMPVIDLTAILAAIRIASFGHEMDIETTCPKCKTTSDYALDLRHVIESVVPGDYEKPIEVAELKIFVQPLLYKDLNENNKAQFTDQQISSIVQSEDMDEAERLKLLSDAFKKISSFTISTLQKGIRCIQTPEATVSDPEHILEFLQNAESTMYEKIRDGVTRYKEKESLKPLHIKCDECGHEYKQPFTLDMTSFFDHDS